MSASAWEDLKEEIYTQLLIGKENGEAELETITGIVWSERENCLALVISGQLRQAALAALDDLEKTSVDEEAGCLAEFGFEVGLESVEKTSTDQTSGGLQKGKVLEWKTGSRSTRAFKLGADSLAPRGGKFPLHDPAPRAERRIPQSRSSRGPFPPPRKRPAAGRLFGRRMCSLPQMWGRRLKMKMSRVPRIHMTKANVRSNSGTTWPFRSTNGP